MAVTLQEVLLAPDTRPQVVTDCCQLIEQQVSDMSGASGTAIKLAFKTVTSFAPGYFRKAVANLVPKLTVTLEPYWQDFSHSGGSDFGDYLAKHGEEVTRALLSVTDAIADGSGRPVIRRAYHTVRGGAAQHVQAALPDLGQLVFKHAA